MQVKTGDTVKVLTGKDRGKTGKVLSVDREKGRAMVEGVNIYSRHQGPKKVGEKGQILETPMPIHVSNLMLIDPASGKPTRISYTRGDKGRKQRVAKKSGKVIK